VHASALALVEILVVVVVVVVVVAVADFCVFCGRLECGEACAAETSNEPRMLTLLAGHVIGWSPVPSRAGWVEVRGHTFNRNDTTSQMANGTHRPRRQVHRSRLPYVGPADSASQYEKHVLVPRSALRFCFAAACVKCLMRGGGGGCAAVAAKTQRPSPNKLVPAVQSQSSLAT